MEHLAGYIAAVCVGVSVAYLSQFLVPKIKIQFWISHNFLYTIPTSQLNAPQQNQSQPQLPSPNPPAAATQAQPTTFKILTHSITVQNFGRKTAEWVEIVHRKRPDFFQFFPSLDYTESATPAGEHVMHVNSLAQNEWFTVQILSYLNMPELLYIRSAAGHATTMPWMYARKFPRWVYLILQLLAVIGSGFCVYWLIRGGVFLFKLMHG